MAMSNAGNEAAGVTDGPGMGGRDNRGGGGGAIDVGGGAINVEGAVAIDDVGGVVDVGGVQLMWDGGTSSV